MPKQLLSSQGVNRSQICARIAVAGLAAQFDLRDITDAIAEGIYIVTAKISPMLEGDSVNMADVVPGSIPVNGKDVLQPRAQA